MADLWLLCTGAAAISLAAFLAGVVGFAYGLVALPLLLASGVGLGDVVVVNLAVGLVTRTVVVARRRRDVSRRRVILLVLGSLPGVGVGLLARDHVAARSIQLAAGVLSLVAIAAIVYRARHRPTATARPRTTVAAGVLGGFLGATTSLNGVPPAVLLTGDGASARSMVADLAVYFVVGNLLTLGALVESGHAPSTWVWGALGVWLPLAVLANYVGTELGPRLPHGLFRRITVAVIVVSAVASIVEALR